MEQFKCDQCDKLDDKAVITIKGVEYHKSGYTPRGARTHFCSLKCFFDYVDNAKEDWKERLEIYGRGRSY